MQDLHYKSCNYIGYPSSISNDAFPLPFVEDLLDFFLFLYSPEKQNLALDHSIRGSILFYLIYRFVINGYPFIKQYSALQKCVHEFNLTPCQ